MLTNYYEEEILPGNTKRVTINDDTKQFNIPQKIIERSYFSCYIDESTNVFCVGIVNDNIEPNLYFH